MLAEIARVEGFHFEDTLTGFKWIGSRSSELSQSGKYRHLFGYEEAIGFACGDAIFDKESLAWQELDTWKMFYEGVGNDGKHRIMMAESKDGQQSWNKAGLVFDVGTDGEWDEAGVGAPHIVR